MADSSIAITAGSGTTIDTRTESTNSNHRQVIVIGDPSTNAGIAPVDATAGLKVNLGADNDVTVTGTVTANLSATDNAVLDTIETNTDFGTVTGGGTETGALRVTIANNSTGVVSIDDNGGSLTIDNSDITTIAGAVSGSEMQVDVVAALPAGTNAIGKVGHDITGLGHGVKTVTTAGTDEALAGSTSCKRVVIQAQTDNTGLIAVGGSGVDATEATGTGIILYAGDAFELETDNLADIFIDSTVNGEGVRYTYFT